MKKVLILLLGILVVSSCSSSTPIPSNSIKAEQDLMKGVKTMTITKVDASMRFGELRLGDTIDVVVNYYDENGFIVHTDYYDEDGLTRQYSYVWDGKHEEQTETYYSIYSKRTYHKYVDYDDAWRMIYAKSTHEEKTLSEEWIEYDNNGNILSRKTADSFDSSPHIIMVNYEYQYDKNGRILKYTESYSYDGSHSDNVDKYSYHYEKDGSYTVEQELIDNASQILKYDKRGNLIESYYMKDNTVGFRTVSECDKNGRITKSSVYDGDVPKEVYLYEYTFY